MIRLATADDLPRIVEMGRRFHAAGGLPGEYDPEASAAFAAGIIERGAIFVSEAGMIGGVLAPVFCAPSWVQAVELFWWSEDRRGMALLGAFEEWAMVMGASEVRMSSIEGFGGERVASMLARRGYAPAETSYARVL